MSTEKAARPILEYLNDVALVDHHVHSVSLGDLDRHQFETMITEAPDAPPAPANQFDSQVGFAIRRWCAPHLDLEPSVDDATYLRRRIELGSAEVTRRLLRSSNIERYLVDTGFRVELLADDATLSELASAAVNEIVRLERIAEMLLSEAVDGQGFADAFRERLAQAASRAVGVKSIIAYRFGFDFNPERPSDGEVARAATMWMDRDRSRGAARIDDPLLLRFLLWSAVDLGLPIQMHTGYGDPDLDLRRADPLLLRKFLELTLRERATPIVLLHSYPFHRNSGYLAQVYPHVWFDIGLAVNYVGARASSIVGESLELAPFRKILYSSDAWGPAELHALGAQLWRRASASVFGSFVDNDEWNIADAMRVGEMIGRRNAIALYKLERV